MTYTVIQLQKMLKVSRGTLYKRLEMQEIKPFITTVNGTKVLKSEGLPILYVLCEGIIEQKEPVMEPPKIQEVDLKMQLIEQLKHEIEGLKQDKLRLIDEVAEYRSALIGVPKLETVEMKKKREWFRIFNR